MADAEEPGYGLVMPFVVCASQGGPYDDAAFVAGYRLGLLDALLDYEAPPLWDGYVQPADVPQLDLIAMRRSYTLQSTPHDDDWTHVRLTKIGADGG